MVFEKGSPIFQLVDRKVFLKKFQRLGLKELSQQSLFNICSTKLFLEKN